MEYMEFVCHAPSDYFKSNKAPYPTINNSPELCYIWSSLGPEIRVAPAKLDDVFGPEDNLKTDNNVSQTPPKKTKVEKVKVKEEKKFIVVEWAILYKSLKSTNVFNEWIFMQYTHTCVLHGGHVTEGCETSMHRWLPAVSVNSKTPGLEMTEFLPQSYLFRYSLHLIGSQKFQFEL